MKRSRANAMRTREALLTAAVEAFARHGLGGTTFQHVAQAAGVTRGAVYWHFGDRDSLVREVFAELRWPLDIGADLHPYVLCHNPLSLLRETLVRHIDQSLADPRQRSLLTLLLSQPQGPGTPAPLPTDLQARFERGMADASARLVAICTLAEARGLLRPGQSPRALGECLHALALDGLRRQCLSGLLGPSASPRMAISWVLQGASLGQG